MTLLRISKSNILGSAYYCYELTSSTYSPNIDTSFTITCNVKSVFGNNVNGKSITLYKDGTSVGSATTNSNGVATWTVTLSDWENHHFAVENASLDLKADGWKKITVTTGNLWVNGATKMALYTFTRTGTITSEISYANVIPSDYRPKEIVRMLGHNSTFHGKLSIDTSGTVKISGGTSSNSITFSGQITYGYGV